MTHFSKEATDEEKSEVIFDGTVEDLPNHSQIFLWMSQKLAVVQQGNKYHNLNPNTPKAAGPIRRKNICETDKLLKQVTDVSKECTNTREDHFNVYGW